jgi:hypothetical protein
MLLTSLTLAISIEYVKLSVDPTSSDWWLVFGVMWWLCVDFNKHWALKPVDLALHPNSLLHIRVNYSGLSSHIVSTLYRGTTMSVTLEPILFMRLHSLMCDLSISLFWHLQKCNVPKVSVVLFIPSVKISLSISKFSLNVFLFVVIVSNLSAYFAICSSPIGLCSL